MDAERMKKYKTTFKRGPRAKKILEIESYHPSMDDAQLWSDFEVKRLHENGIVLSVDFVSESWMRVNPPSNDIDRGALEDDKHCRSDVCTTRNVSETYCPWCGSGYRWSCKTNTGWNTSHHKPRIAYADHLKGLGRFKAPSYDCEACKDLGYIDVKTPDSKVWTMNKCSCKIGQEKYSWMTKSTNNGGSDELF